MWQVLQTPFLLSIVPSILSAWYLKRKGYSFFPSVWKSWLGWFALMAMLGKFV